MHAPCSHVAPLGQARSQAPQWAGSVFVSAQASPQRSLSCGHTHCPAVQLAASGQARSHEPQWAASAVKSAQSVPQTCCPVGHTQAPPTQAAARGHLLPQAPQCEALLCVSTHSVPQTTPLLHVSAAPPVPALDAIALPAAPAVPGPELSNKPPAALPQWISPRAASRITTERRPPGAALQAERRRCSFDDLRIEVEGGRIRSKPQAGSPAARGTIPQPATRGHCLSKSIDAPCVERHRTAGRARAFGAARRAS